MRIAILGYSIASVPPWDPDSCKTGLAGSEEAVVYASNELASRNITVHVYMNPPAASSWTSPLSNPRWFKDSEFGNSNNHNAYDLVLLWRRFDVAVGRTRSSKVFFWGHDSPPEGVKAPFPPFDCLCLLSQHHVRQFREACVNFESIPHIICGNGVILEQFSKPCCFTNKHSIGYFSSYARGLLLLLMIWPKVRQQYPKATLDIYYGRETWNTISPEVFNSIISKIEAYQAIGVTEHGKVGHEQLAEVMQKTSLWAYPCIATSETFCITAVKCQLAGMIPVTSRIAALDETVSREAPGIPVIRNNTDLLQYQNILLNTLENADTIDRTRFIEFAKRFSWKACVDKWLEALQAGGESLDSRQENGP